MKKHLVLLLIVFVFTLGLSAQEAKKAEKAVKVDLGKEKAAIKATALNYIEGWFEGSKERMAKALHPALHKVGLRPFRKDGNPVLTPIGYTAMVELARMGVGKRTPPEKRNIKVKILDIDKNMACVKSMCSEFNDYLLMAKMDGQWKIVNVLWVPAK